MTRRLPTTLAALAAALAPAAQAFAQGCAMCGSSFGTDDPAAKAINYSILFLMAAPYTLCAAVGGWLWLRHRRASAPRRGAVLRLPWPRRRPAPAGGPEEV
jgi:hypothetical protein